MQKKQVLFGAVAALLVAVSAVGFISVRGDATATSSVSQYRSWETPRPFRVPADLIINVFAEADQSSPILVKLQPTAIAYGLGEYGPPGATPSSMWKKVRTGSNTIGWVKSEQGEPLTVTEAEEVALRQQTVLEEYVRETITEAVVTKLGLVGLHGGGPPDDIKITAPLSKTESSALFRAPVSALMHGAILSSNKYQVDAEVKVFLHFDKDYLPASKVEIKNVEILSNEQLRGITGMQVVQAARIFSGLGF